MGPGLEFARPFALYGAALAVPIAVLHLYRKRRRRLVVAFAPLLREAASPVRSLGGFARIAEGLRLALRLLALAALTLAAAGARPAGARVREPVDLVVVLDGDVTQRATESDAGATLVERRFDRSVALATAILRAPTDGLRALVLAGREARTLVAPTADVDAVVRALDPLDPERGGTELAPALAAARAMRREGRTTRIVVVTARALPAGFDDVEVATAGRTSFDLGFVDVAAVIAPDGQKTRARFVLKNFDVVPRPAHVRIGWRGAPTPLEERDADVGPGVESDVVLDVLPPKGGGILDVVVSGPNGARDAFAGNDAAALALTPAARPSVLVVHRGEPRPFVRAILDALGDGVDRDGSGFVATADAASASPRDLVIYDATMPPAALAGRPSIFLAPFPPGADGPFRRGRTVTEPLVWRATAGHPLLRGVDLSTAYVASATTISGDGVDGLAFVEGEAVLAEGGPPGGRFVVLGLDPEGSDLPVRAALPILLRNAIRRLSVVPAAPLPAFVRAGEPMTARAAIGGPWSLEFEGTDPFPVSRREYERARSSARGATGDEAAAALSRLARTEPAPLRADLLGPDAPGPTLPVGGPFVVTLRDPASGSLRAGTRTVLVDLDRHRDIRPARAESPLPAPPPPREDDPAQAWMRLLLGLAALLLIVDAAIGGLVRGKVARGSTTS